MSVDDETAELLDDLASGDPDTRVIALQDLIKFPTGTPEVLSAVRLLLQDRSPAVISIPYSIG